MRHDKDGTHGIEIVEKIDRKGRTWYVLHRDTCRLTCCPAYSQLHRAEAEVQRIVEREKREQQRAMVAAKIENMPHGGDRKSENQDANLHLEVTRAEAAEMVNVRPARKRVKISSEFSADIRTLQAALRDLFRS
jgi:hypothetical protein